MDNEEYAELYGYVVYKKYKDGLDENKKRSMRKKASNIVLEGDELYRIGQPDEFGIPKKGLIITADRKNSVLKECHMELGNHLGRDKTMALLKNRYYWNGMYRDVSNFIQNCLQCQNNSRKNGHTIRELVKPVEAPLRPFQRVAINLIGPFMDPENISRTLSDKGYVYVLNCMDLYSRYPETFCLDTKKAGEVAEKIYELKCRYSIIEEIVSDQDDAFNNSLKDELRKVFSFKHIIISTYDKETSGMLDKLNQAMWDMISKSQSDGDAANWHKHIHSVCYTYRMAKHPDTKSSPFFLLFNQKLMKYSNDIATLDDFEMTSNVNNKEFKCSDFCEQISENVSDNVGEDVQKTTFDLCHDVCKKEFNIGEKVLLKNGTRQRDIYKINLTTYKGPYVIDKYVGRGNYQLKHVQNNKILGIHNQRNFQKYSEGGDTKNLEPTHNEKEINLNSSCQFSQVDNSTKVSVAPFLFEGSYSAGVSIKCTPEDLVTDQPVP